MSSTAQEVESKQNTINLFDIGVLVNLRIKMWTARKIITRADLIEVGFDPDKLPADICNLGRKMLVPKSEIQALTRIDQRARKSLERFSVPFGICNAHFIPIKMLITVEQQLMELQTEFFTRVDSFITRFDELKNKVKETHPEFWEKCLKHNYPSDPKALRERFQFDWYTFRIAGMGSIEETSVEEAIASQKIQTEREGELRQQMRNEVGVFVEGYVSTMRKETVEFCNLMTARINGTLLENEVETKKLTPRSISCFRKYVDRFRNMNIFGEKEIEKMLIDFKDTYLDSGVVPGDFGSARVKDSITSALSAIGDKAATEGESGSQFIGQLKRRVRI